MNSNLSCRRLKRNELLEVRETQIPDPSTDVCKRVKLRLAYSPIGLAAVTDCV